MTPVNSTVLTWQKRRTRTVMNQTDSRVSRETAVPQDDYRLCKGTHSLHMTNYC